jgi:hypothetical protein
MSDRPARYGTMSRIVIVLVGILIIASLIMMAKVFLKGMLAGIAFAGCVAVLVWISWSMKRKR